MFKGTSRAPSAIPNQRATRTGYHYTYGVPKCRDSSKHGDRSRLRLLLALRKQFAAPLVLNFLAQLLEKNTDVFLGRITRPQVRDKEEESAISVSHGQNTLRHITINDKINARLSKSAG